MALSGAVLTSAEARSTFVVVPAFNEAPRIEAVLRALLDLDVNVVVVDDGSTDGTAERARLLPIALLRHRINLGQGASLQTGIDYAVGRGAGYIVTFDADGQHDVANINRLVRRLVDDDLDIVLGSRFLGHAHGITTSRRLLLKAAVVFTRLTVGMRLTDAHNGLRAFRSSAAPALRITQNRMSHASEIIQLVHDARLRYAEVPVSVSYTPETRRKGQSALGAIDVLYDMLFVRWFRP